MKRPYFSSPKGGLSLEAILTAKDISGKLLYLNELGKSIGKRSTLGVVADLKMYSADALCSCLPNKDAVNGIRLAKALNSRFIVLAGNLMSTSAGAISIPVSESESAEENLLSGVCHANSRVAEVSDHTSWLTMTSPELGVRVINALRGQR